MGLVVVVLVVAGLGAALTGRRWSATALHGRSLVLLAVLAQAAGGLVGGRAYGAGLAVSALLVAAFLLRNRGLRGVGLVSLGLLANAVVVVADGAMPVSLAAAARASVDVSDLLAGVDPRHVVATSATSLRWLGDVLPVPLPLAPEVVSAGDVLVAAGLAQLVLSLTRGRGGTPRPAPPVLAPPPDEGVRLLPPGPVRPRRPAAAPSPPRPPAAAGSGRSAPGRPAARP